MSDPLAEEVNRKLGEAGLSSLKTLASLLAIISVIIAGMFWVFNVDAKASSANAKADDLANELKKKADKDDIREIKENIEKIRDYLMKGNK